MPKIIRYGERWQPVEKLLSGKSIETMNSLLKAALTIAAGTWPLYDHHKWQVDKSLDTIAGRIFSTFHTNC